MLRLLATGNSLPYSFGVDPSAQFEPGFIGQLTVIGNQVLCTVSNGTAPIGIIDDINTKAFTANAWDETILTLPTGGVTLNGAGQIVSVLDTKVELKNPNILSSSFVSIPLDLALIPRNGVVIIPAGTAVNYDLLGTGIPNAFKTNVRYSFQIPNIVGDSSVLGSNRVTIWYQRMIIETSAFEANQIYPVNCNLFCSEQGLFTSRQYAPNIPSVGICTAPPSPLSATLQLMWL